MKMKRPLGLLTKNIYFVPFVSLELGHRTCGRLSVASMIEKESDAGGQCKEKIVFNNFILLTVKTQAFNSSLCFPSSVCVITSLYSYDSVDQFYIRFFNRRESVQGKRHDSYIHQITHLPSLLCLIYLVGVINSFCRKVL